MMEYAFASSRVRERSLRWKESLPARRPNYGASILSWTMDYETDRTLLFRRLKSIYETVDTRRRRLLFVVVVAEYQGTATMY